MVAVKLNLDGVEVNNFMLVEKARHMFYSDRHTMELMDCDLHFAYGMDMGWLKVNHILPYMLPPIIEILYISPANISFILRNILCQDQVFFF